MIRPVHRSRYGIQGGVRAGRLMPELPGLDTVSPDDYRRVREVFDAVLERPHAERRAYLDLACKGDFRLRAEVERMLYVDAQTHALIDGADGANRSSSTVAPAACPSCRTALMPGHRFCPSCGSPVVGDGREGRFRAGALFANRFRIVAVLGRGGMGEVYRAHDLELGQPVALKFLTALWGDERARARLRNEVRLARQLAHPNVCRVYDIGEAHGELYLSMEFVDGEDLAALLKRIGRLPVDKGIEIARKLCAGLAAAHAKGVLHRDFKPANIMIDGRGEVRIMDFGLAATADQLDASEVRSGTPAYMAPEQLAGREATPQSDLYALGLVLYELFTGKPAFSAKDLQDLQRQRESHPSTTPSTLIPDLGPRVERAILRCLEPDPKLRPASALEVSATLPGGDPLAEALAAGETPSPEMVAAAGPTDGLQPRAALALLACVAVSLMMVLLLTPSTSMLGKLPLEVPPEELSIRARDIARSLGYTDEPADVAAGFDWDSGYLARVRANTPRLADREAAAMGAGRWPRRRGRSRSRTWRVQRLWFPSSRAVAFGALPANRTLPEAGPIRRHARSQRSSVECRSVADRAADASRPIAGEPDWSALFRAAGLDMNRFAPCESRTPSRHCRCARRMDRAIPRRRAYSRPY